MRSLFWTLAISLSLTTATVASDLEKQNLEGQQKIIEIGKNDNRVVDTLDHLVNGIGPRLTGSYQDHIACNWAKDLFEEFGLENVVMEEAGEFPVGFQRGPWRGQMIAPEVMDLEFGTPAWSAGTRGVEEGRAMTFPGGETEFNAADFKDAWIFMPSQRGRRNREDRQREREFREKLQEVGIGGWVYPSRGETITILGSSRVSWDNLPTIPRVTLRRDQYDAIVERIEKGEEVTLRMDIRNHFQPGPVKFYNVIGDIVGTEFPDEYVIIGGHIDSWDGATGTTDNGMGTATTIEAARILAASGIKPRRTIRFMLWSGEEQGLLGSKAWVANNPDAMDKISAVFVYDGGPNAIAGTWATAAMKEDMQKVFAPMMDLNPDLPFELKDVDSIPRGIGSDHESFIAKGVPGFFWNQEGRADTWYGIHTQKDTFDRVIPEYLEHSTTVIALTAFGLANLDTLLSREGLFGASNDDEGEEQPRRRGGGRMLGVFLDENVIEEVLPDTAASRAGFKAGDKVIEVGGAEVTDRMSLVRAIRAEGEKKKVIIMRDGKKMELMVDWQPRGRNRARQGGATPEPPAAEEKKPEPAKPLELR